MSEGALKLSDTGERRANYHTTPRTAYDRVAALVVRDEPDPCGRDFTVEGRDRLFAFCAEHRVPQQRVPCFRFL